MDIEHRRERTRQSVRVWRLKNAEKHRAAVRAWRLANPEKFLAISHRRAQRLKAAAALRRAEKAAAREANREAAAERLRTKRHAYYLANREKILEAGRRWREAHPEYKSTGSARAWRKANPEKRRAYRKARKIKKSQRLHSELSRLQNGRCAYCRTPLSRVEVQVDHIVPLAKGGPDHRSNLQLTCAPCNLLKSARHPVEFAQSLGRLL